MKKLLLLGFSLFFLVSSIKAQNSISGYTVSLETAKPIANATVFLKNKYNLPLEDSGSLKATSDSTGFYKIAGIKAGTYIMNAWTTYRAMDQRYAMVIASDRIEVNRNLNVDFVFSENAFKYRLHAKFHLKEALELLTNKKERSSDSVAFRAVLPQIYIDSERASMLTWYIKNISNNKKDTANKAH
ncbi:MAG TPA: carboxypeptidase-like regulatory domain-containing protein [Balneolaceae bacterium]